MTTTERAPAATGVVYDLEGTLLEACSCLAVCPCWVGQDPDGGSCDAFNAYRFERGTVALHPVWVPPVLGRQA